MTLKFLGQEFATVEALKAVYPAFAGDDAVRAIRGGCTTPLEVERYCWQHKEAGIRRSRAAARKNAVVVNEKAAKARERGKKAKAKPKARAA